MAKMDWGRAKSRRTIMGHGYEEMPRRPRARTARSLDEAILEIHRQLVDPEEEDERMTTARARLQALRQRQSEARMRVQSARADVLNKAFDEALVPHREES